MSAKDNEDTRRGLIMAAYVKPEPRLIRAAREHERTGPGRVLQRLAEGLGYTVRHQVASTWEAAAWRRRIPTDPLLDYFAEPIDLYAVGGLKHPLPLADKAANVAWCRTLNPDALVAFETRWRCSWRITDDSLASLTRSPALGRLYYASGAREWAASSKITATIKAGVRQW